jgi:hypothetical protein
LQKLDLKKNSAPQGKIASPRTAPLLTKPDAMPADRCQTVEAVTLQPRASRYPHPARFHYRFVSSTSRRFWYGLSLGILGLLLGAGIALADPANLVKNAGFEQRTADGKSPAKFILTGQAVYRYLGDPRKDSSSWGVAFPSARSPMVDTSPAGSVSQTVSHIDTSAGRWFRFAFRGLAQDEFAVNEDDDLSMRVEYFGNGGQSAYDGKNKPIYPQIRQDRRDLTVNGDFHRGGAAVWRTYELVFRVPFAQIDTLRLSVNFAHGRGGAAADSSFFIDDWSLTRVPDPPTTEPAGGESPSDGSIARHPVGKLIPVGGRWFYEASGDQTSVPEVFDHTNAERLLYHDNQYTAPFAGNTEAWLRAGHKDLQGNIVTQDRLITDNVTVEFDDQSMIIHTRGLPNHPTGKFPETTGRGYLGLGGNPNFIQEHDRTYFIPLDPKVNARHIFTTRDNSNHALPMGPIGIAANGIVFYNPFDANSQDASNMMDACCGHPDPGNNYHYHKYPVCINSPWADEGKQHSPLIGWAFDGFPIYGPFESAGVMAKDVSGDNALNDFNIHWDKDRGWHYHVTPGKFPYIIGGYWGTEDSRDIMRPRSGMNGRGSMSAGGNQNGSANGPANANGGGPNGGGPNGGGPNGGGPPPFPPPFGRPPPGQFNGQ